MGQFAKDDVERMFVTGIDHVQIAAPKGCEPEARTFFGHLLMLEAIEKPEPLRSARRLLVQGGFASVARGR